MSQAEDRVLGSAGSLAEFLRLRGLPPAPQPGAFSPRGYWDGLPPELSVDVFGDYPGFARELAEFTSARRTLGGGDAFLSLSVLGGRDKGGRPEAFSGEFLPGQVIAVVGPTGSGKSRLLADIECLAQGDSPSGRRVLVNGAAPGSRTRFSLDSKLVAQISQNMNFVMDLSVASFLALHAESRGKQLPAEAVDQVYRRAQDLCGEPFAIECPLTQLSGGQSRALMIADAAYLSPKPIVLIDEIENAGVDRRRALGLFTEMGKLVFLSTHDPLLALEASRRLVVSQGAIVAVLDQEEGEREAKRRLLEIDLYLKAQREALRAGGRVRA